MITAAEPVGRRWRAIGTWCEVLISLPGGSPAELDGLAEAARTYAAEQLADLDQACSRFRADSELVRLPHGTATSVSTTLNEALAAALRTARATGGLVDPTVGAALRANGYDADLDVIRDRDPGRAVHPAAPAPGHWRLYHDPVHREVLVPHRVELDLGASAKAWAADRIAAGLSEKVLPAQAGALVNLGGDLAVSGPPPEGGWRIAVDDAWPDGDQPLVTIHSGGLATSSTALRTWTQGGEHRQHIVDPRTGRSATPLWRAVTVAARSCELANAAATAAVVLGSEATGWLTERGVHARLRHRDGSVVLVGGWPADARDPAVSSVDGSGMV